MAIYNSLSWQNETALSAYPFSEDQEIQNLIVDAKFVQFDNFLPILNHIIVTPDRFRLSMTFDYGTDTTIVFMKSSYDQGEAYRSLRLFTSDGGRYLGVLVFGIGAEKLWKTAVGKKIQSVGTFAVETVRSVPSNDAVYLLDGNYGDLILGRTSDDSTMFYNTSTALNSITFNAVGGHAIPDGAVKEGLRKINLVPPVNNNINISSNDVIKIKSFNGASLTIELVAGASTSSFTIPTLIA